MVGCKDLVHAQREREGNEQPRKFRQFIRKFSRILDKFYFFEPCWGQASLSLGVEELSKVNRIIFFLCQYNEYRTNITRCHRDSTKIE